MPYGTLKADTLTYYTATGDVNLAISGIAISGSPLISGVSGVFTTSVSGATVTGNAGQFTTITGGTAEFTNITGVSGTFTSRISGATVTGTSGQFTTLTATTGVFTTSISGATISGDVGLFTTISGSQGVFNSGLSVPSGTAASPSISFNGDPNTGLYSTGADALALSTNGTGRLFVSSAGNVSIGASGAGQRLRVNVGTDQNFAVTSTNSVAQLQGINDAGNAFVPIDVAGSNIRISPNSSEIARFTSTGLGVGTSVPSYLGEFVGGSGGSETTLLQLRSNATDTNTATSIRLTNATAAGSTSSCEIASIRGAGGVSSLALRTSDGSTPATRVTIDPSGRVGIGTTAVDVKTQIVKNALTKSWSADGDDVLAIENSGTTNVDFRSGSSSSTYLMFSDGDARARGYVAYLHSSDALLLGAANSERARIDSSGRLLVGTSTSRTVGRLVGTGNFPNQYPEQIEGANAFAGLSLITNRSSDETGSVVTLGKTRSASLGGVTIVNNGDDLGAICFAGADGTDIESLGGAISCQVDGTPGANDMPGRLVFSTTADGASSPTERVRISQNGVVTVKNGAVAEIGTLTDGATVTPDFAANCNFTLTISGNRTLANPTNITAGQTGSIFIIQGTGSNTLSWGSYWDFAGGTAPTLSTASGAVDRVDYVVRTSTSIHTVFTANYS